MIGVTLCACLFGVWGHWDYLPGTIRRDKTNGFIHGTGSLVGFYWDGTLAVQEDYRNGILLRQIWYRPDGSLFVSSDFDTKQGGTAYNLRYDGTIRTKIRCKYSPATRQYISDGPAVFYRPNGSIDHTTEYRDGQPVEQRTTE
jgi:hypothetical protein